MSRHRAPGEQPVPVEVVEEPPSAPERISRTVRRAALLVLFALLVLILLTLIQEVRYGRAQLAEQIGLEQAAARERGALLDDIEQQSRRIDALTQALRQAGVDPATVPAAPTTAPRSPRAGSGTAPGAGATPTRGGARTTTSPSRTAASPSSVPARPTADTDPAPPPSTTPPAPTTPPCLLGVPGAGCVVHLPGVLGLGALYLLQPPPEQLTPA